jgi:hypothetical protein
MAAHQRKEEDDEKFCSDVYDLRSAKEDGKVAIVLQGERWMDDIRDALKDDDPDLLAQVERIVVRNMGMKYYDNDTFALILSHMPALKHLEFACHHWGPSGFEPSFCSDGLAQLKRLESIELYELHLSDSAALNVAKAFAALPHLKRVDIAQADRFDSDWGTREEAKKAEKLTLKGYTALFDVLRGRIEFLKLHLDLATNGIGIAKHLEAMVSGGLKELDVSIGTYGASDKQEAQARAEFTALLRHFAACPSLTILAFDVSLVPPDTVLDAIARNPHLDKLTHEFTDEWTLDQYCKMLKIVYASKILAFKQSGYLSFKKQQWWRIARLVKQFADKKGWRGYEGDLEVYNRLSSDDIERVWASSRYRTSDVSSDETPDSRESLFEEDGKLPRAPAAAAAATTAAPAPAARMAPAARPGVSMPARVGGAGAPRGPTPTPPSRGATPATPPSRGAMPSRGATPTPPSRGVPSRGVTPTPPSRGATPTPPARAAATPTPAARSGAAAASGLSGRAAIAAARAPPPKPAPVVDDSVSGNWKLKDKKSIKNEASVLDEAIASIKSKLGDEWAVVIDWVSFGEATSERDDREPGENVIQRVVNKFVSNDVDEFDSDVVDALNGLCATKRITFSCVRQHGDGQRVVVRASAKGVEIVWSADWYGYQYDRADLRDWTLNNC